MGMSATQARFLSLTARKSNVEFEGQQINQQRTTLSNESASYYSELCNMEVPTPPSVDDYTKVSYTFNDGAMTNTIISMLAKGNGEYSISYLQQWQDDYSITPSSSALIARNEYYYDVDENDEYDSKTDIAFFQYSVGTSKLRVLGDLNNEFIVGSNDRYLDYDDKTDTFYTYNDDGERVDLGTDDFEAENFEDDPYYQSLSGKQRMDLLKEEIYYTKMLQDKYGADTTWAVRYVKNTSTGSYEPYFYKIDDLNNAEKYTVNDLANINCYSLGSSTQTKEVLNQKGVVEKDSSGRFIGITLFDDNGNQTSYSLTTTTTTDEEAYNDAMNQYNYAQHEYDSRIQEINSKLEIVQQQDKNLELKLKQLDTEENAISTEVDAVKKVISKNVESSFKTFNA